MPRQEARRQPATNNYNKKNCEVKRSCRKHKRERIDSIAWKAEEAAEKNDIKKVYDTTKVLCGKKGVQSKPVKVKSGTVLTNIKDQLAHWREHFHEVLNRPPPMSQPDLSEAPPLAIKTGPITKAKVKSACKTLSSGKAAGLNNIPAEAWKEGGWVSEEVLYSLLNNIWVAEDIPMDWKLGLLVKLPKKGDLNDCANLQGIMLLSIASKILIKIILTRMQDNVEKGLRDQQAGFCRGRCDQITTLRIIIEQTIE